MNRQTIDLWVGVFLTLGVAALLFLALQVGNLSSAQMGETYDLEARFSNIGGLKVRGPVKSAGVVVGRISEITFDADTLDAVVKMKIDNRYKFPRDTFAAIYTAGLLGEQFVGLDVGGDEKNFQPGEVIRNTQSAVVLEKLVSQFLFSKAAEGSNP